ncbi:MAG TPA: hypothetical protein VF398_05965, partial [bacterium]
ESGLSGNVGDSVAHRSRADYGYLPDFRHLGPPVGSVNRAPKTVNRNKSVHGAQFAVHEL